MMRGYTTNYVNLIADNLRDRYENGFPVLKELIQNADDAKARTLIFGTHPGFPDASSPLLKGSGLWCFNDGEFKQSDIEGLRSFGINSKAGDAKAIGKFGLGMKSVFHLCEALFYVAWDGTKLHREGLTPWKQDGPMPHPEWDETSDADWSRLEKFGKEMVAPGCCSWFLLWIPLRSRRHLKTQSGEESGAIISRFPGDDDSSELAFLCDRKLAHDMAEILPLLRHLEHVEHRGENNCFALRLDFAGAPRLLSDPSSDKTNGNVTLADGRPLLAFSGLRTKSESASFGRMKERDEWPRIRYRDALGHERPALDKASPEAAVLFCSGHGENVCSRLHWAVFLPVENDSEDLGTDRGKRTHSLILHGQFFVDAGRKKIRDSEKLHKPPVGLDDESIDESLLRTVWNQRLAQEVLLPLVLPALKQHARQQKLADDECNSLTKAISKSGFFKRFRWHVCRDGTWVRTLQRGANPGWRLVDGDRGSRLRPLPTTQKSAPDRPWKVFPKLNACDVVPYDVTAPRLSRAEGPDEWPKEELEGMLSQVNGLFVDAPSMDYLIKFLDLCAGSHKTSERIQRRLLDAMRNGLREAGGDTRRRVAAAAGRLVGFLQPERWLELASELPEPILKDLWAVDASVLLVPKGMKPKSRGEESAARSKASPDEPALALWLEVLDRALDSLGKEGAHQPILEAVQGLLRTLSTADRSHFLRGHRTLRVIRVQDARNGVEKPVSVEYLDRVRSAGCLFSFVGGLRDVAMGIAPDLARALPDAEVCLVRAQTYRELFSEDESRGGGSRIPAASDSQACLAAAGRYADRLGSLTDRRGLLEQANDSGTDVMARRGLRFLLHGSPDHRNDDDAKLWIGGHGQHSAWSKLWSALHADAQWSLIPDSLANTVPRGRWSNANIAEVDAQTLIAELRKTGQTIETSEAFSADERDEILSRIEDKDLWLRLPLHTAVDGRPVPASENVYLAPPPPPPALDQEDPLTGEATLVAPSENALVAANQQCWLRRWDERARIEIALGTRDPLHYWRSVMDALGGLSDDVLNDLGDLLRGKAWLPTTHDAPVKPEDVINLQDALRDEAHRLIAEHRASHGHCFAVPEDIDAAVREHEAWERIREVGFSSDSDGLDRLGLLLEDLPDYCIGKWTGQPQPDAIGLLARCDKLPGWRLLETAAEPFDRETVWGKLGPTLSREIDIQYLVAVLDWISGDNDQWELRKSAHDDYLRQLTVHCRTAREHLPRLRLASADGSWREAAELCADAPSVVCGSLLDMKQKGILGDLVCRANSSLASDQPGVPMVDFSLARNAASNILCGYFGQWDSSLVPRPMIGAVLGLLGPDVRKLANEYLHPHSFEWLVGKLQWHDPGEQRWMGGKTAGQALDFFSIAVQVIGDEAQVCNLLGMPIRVALEKNPDTLIAGSLGGVGCEAIIPLRCIDPDQFRPEQLGKLLCATAECLYRYLYNQIGVDFGGLWKELDQSDQLEIGTARRLILEHIPFYLRQLSVRHESIEKQLAVCDRLQRRVVEAEANDEQSAESERKERRRALDDLADRIDESPGAVVQAVKSKLEQYQYELSSIPLELFQNADDAAVESGYCHAYPSEGRDVRESAQRFVVEERKDGLGFLHWGRPINARGPVGFDGQGRGYDRDLEKMLILSASDKPGHGDVTGKFGLGFKSVLLACEQPRILSGRLAVRVVAGILPQPWKDIHEARQRLTGFGTDSTQPGTLIDLPGVDREARARVLERFRQLAGILCIFGRAIRSVTRVGASESSWSWKPHEICPNVEAGELCLQGEWGDRTMALCVRTSEGSVLMALGPGGFRPLPDTVPALWVTVPTREESAVGFVVNGSFDLDAGRGRLAGRSGNNLETAKRIGRHAGDALGALLERSCKDWGSVRADLRLAADLDALDFWESIWSGLTKGWLRRPHRDGVDLAREVALGVLTRLSARSRAVPNGLKGSLRGFSDAGEIRFQLSEVLLQADVGELMGAWKRFAKRYPGETCVSKEIGDILREAGLCEPQSLGLSALVGLLEHSRVQPDDAEVLGRLWLLTEESKDWKSDDLRDRLHKLLFRSEADKWVESRTLLASRGRLESDDEPRRHRLAPSERRLHADYYAERDDEWPALVFFLLCRQRLDALAETLARWVLDAETAEAQSAALEYLADGDLGERVAERVRKQGWLRTVLNDFQLTKGLTEEQQDRLRRRLIASTRLEQVMAGSDEVHQLIDPHVDLPAALERLYKWWANEGRERAAAYRNSLYPQGFGSLNLKQDPETGRADRPSWFTLLALGSFQGMGRTREEQHRAFIEHCREQGWWTVFIDNDPKKEPEKWLDIIEKYAEAQQDDEEWTQWLAQFPKLYRLRRWLDDYVDLFLSIDRFEEPFTQDMVLAPRSNPYLQGGGIDAPPLTRTLRVGFPFVVRELLHQGVIKSPLAVPHAYAPIERIKCFFHSFGIDISAFKNIHEILANHLGEERATFGSDYDIPLRIISSDALLRHRLLDRRWQ